MRWSLSGLRYIIRLLRTTSRLSVPLIIISGIAAAVWQGWYRYHRTSRRVVGVGLTWQAPGGDSLPSPLSVVVNPASGVVLLGFKAADGGLQVYAVRAAKLAALSQGQEDGAVVSVSLKEQALGVPLMLGKGYGLDKVSAGNDGRWYFWRFTGALRWDPAAGGAAVAVPVSGSALYVSSGGDVWTTASVAAECAALKHPAGMSFSHHKLVHNEVTAALTCVYKDGSKFNRVTVIHDLNGEKQVMGEHGAVGDAPIPGTSLFPIIKRAESWFNLILAAGDGVIVLKAFIHTWFRPGALHTFWSPASGLLVVSAADVGAVNEPRGWIGFWKTAVSSDEKHVQPVGFLDVREVAPGVLVPLDDSVLYSISEGKLWRVNMN